MAKLKDAYFFAVGNTRQIVRCASPLFFLLKVTAERPEKAERLGIWNDRIYIERPTYGTTGITGKPK